MSGTQDDDQKHVHDKRTGAPKDALQIVLVVDMLSQVCDVDVVLGLV